MLHLALGQHFKRVQAVQNGTDPDEWCEPEEAVELIAQVEGVREHAPIVLRTYQGYRDRFSEADQANWKIRAVEELGQTTIGGRYLLTGRLDLEIEDRAGRIYVLDWKSTGRLTSAHKDFYTVSGQFFGYGRMAREKYGDQFAGVIINLMQLVAHEGDPFKSERIFLPRSPFLESQFERSVVDIEESIERLKAEGRPYDQWPKAMSELVCVHRYGPCEYLNKCRFGADYQVGGTWTWGSP